MINAPTGTVTFLFADLEGSTSAWQNSLAHYNQVLREAAESNGGYVFKTFGDAFCAAFATAEQALEASLAAHQALVVERWDEHAGDQVKMALHTGVAEERDGDYFGPPVDRVARLLSAGSGSQVLLSAETHELVRDVPGFSEFGDLGEDRPKDSRHSERIFVVPDLPDDPLSPHSPDLSSDERYGPKELIGSGGMAEVYLAHDRVLDRDVAFKVLKNLYTDDEPFIERFESEARSAASLSHPNIVQVYDRGKTRDGSYYMVMEHVPGGNLKEHILKEGPLSPDEAIATALHVARALSHAHECGVVHRDVKPQNVLLAGSGEAKVTDFGIARAIAASRMTKTGFIVGTAHYLSPEQALGHPASPRSDLYSLGVVLYEMLTGEVPHDADTPVETVTKHVSGPLRPPKEVNPEVPEELDAVVVRLLARAPEDRYQDAAELIEDLERMRSEEPLALAVAQQQASSSANTSLYVIPDPPAAPPSGEAESKDGRYSLKELIGSGGMAEVYLAHDRVLGRNVAYKRIRQQYAQDEEVVERFGREAKNAASLSHPNIAAVYDWGRTKDGSYYMVMEYVAGGTLKERISKEGRLTSDEAVAIALQVARALRAAHERGVIHRDVKPQNILLAGSGRAKVADFGIARAADASTLTKTGAIMGTVHYLSPEQAIDELVSSRSDLYSLGVVLYEMLTGEVPHDADTPVGILFKHVNGKLRPPRKVNPEVPEGLDAVVVRLLAQNPKDRYQDAAWLIEDLEQIRRGKPAALEQQAPSPAPTSRGARKKGDEHRGWRWTLVPLILLLLALVGGAAYALFPETTAEAAVPDLVGAGSIEEAREIAGDRFDIVEGNRVESREAVGTVVAQTPEAQDAAGQGDIAVDIVSTQISDLPDVEGETREEAERILKEAGFEVEVTTEESSEEDEDLVTGQTPQGGEDATAEVGSTVDITVGEGPAEEVEVPDTYSYTPEGSKQALEKAGLSPGSQTEAPNTRVPAGRISKQQPPAGATVKQSSPVDVVVSSGTRRQPVPNVANENAAEAQPPVYPPAYPPVTEAQPPVYPPAPPTVEPEVENEVEDGGQGRGRGRGRGGD